MPRKYQSKTNLSPGKTSIQIQRRSTSNGDDARTEKKSESKRYIIIHHVSQNVPPGEIRALKRQLKNILKYKGVNQAREQCKIGTGLTSSIKLSSSLSLCMFKKLAD